MASSSGYTTLASKGAATAGGTTAFAGLGDATLTLGVDGNSVAHTTNFVFSSGLDGTADNVKLSIANISGGVQTISISDGTAANAIETLTITGTGANVDAEGSTLANVLVLDALGASKYVFNGTGAVDISGAALTNATTIDGSANTGGFNVSTNVTGTTTVTGGAGNDTVDFATGTFTTSDVVHLGAGTGDTLRITTADAVAITALNPNVSGVEVLRLDAGALTTTLAVRNFEAVAGDVTQVHVDGGIAGGIVTGLTSGDLVRVGAAGTGGTLTVTGATTAGTADVLGVRGTAATSNTDINFGTYTIAGVETINVNSTRTGAAVVGDINTFGFTAANATVYAVAGNVNTNVGTLGTAVTSLTSSISTATVATAGLTATLSGAAGSSATVTTGAGVDVIVSGAGNDIISTGAGADIITIGTGSVSVNAGDGNDIIIIAAAGDLTSADTIDGGAGTDIIRVTGAETFVDADFTNVSNVETLDLDGTAAINVNAGALTAAAFGNSLVIDATGLTGAANINAAAFTATQTLTFDGGNAGTAADTIAGGAGADVINGGTGVDTMTGGAGADRFLFETSAQTDAVVAGTAVVIAADRITDFQAGVDDIVFGIGANAFAATTLTFTTGTTANVTTFTMTDLDNASIDLLLAAIETQAGAAGVASSATVAQVYIVNTGAQGVAGFANKTLLILNDEVADLAATDTIIDITGLTGAFSSADILFAAIA